MENEIRAGVSAETIKGAALAGASLALLASQGVVVTSASALSAAYVAINKGVAGDVFRTVGDIAWEVSDSATKLVRMAASKDDGLKGELSGELAAKVRSVILSNTSVGSSTTSMDLVSDEATTQELQEVLMEAETAIGAADAAIAKANETLTSDDAEDEEAMAQEAKEAEDLAMKLAAEVEAQRKLEEVDQALSADESDDDDDEWLSAVALAQEGLDGKIVGLDDAIADEDAKADWDAAGELAEELRQGTTSDEGSIDEDDDNFDELMDLESIAEAARQAVEMFESEMDVTDLETDDTTDSDLEAAVELFPDGDLAAIVEAAREAVDSFVDDDIEETFEADIADVTYEDADPGLDVQDELGIDFGEEGDLFVPDETTSDSDMDAADDLLPEGDLESIAMAARQAVVSQTDEEEDDEVDQDDFAGFEDDFSSPGVTSSSAPSRNWSSLTVAKLREELKVRGLKSYGKKSDLVAMLEQYDIEQFSGGASTDETQVGSTFDDGELSSSDGNFDFGDVDIEELGRQARAAVENGDISTALFDGEEPSDEVLMQLENEESLLLQTSVDGVTTGSTPDFSNMTVAQLKDELRSRGLKVSGKKAELIARLESEL